MRAFPALSLLLVPWMLLLGSCGSPPRPPTVDESKKRPVNSAMAVELQVCKNDLQNTRIVSNESARTAESTAVTLQQLVLRQQAISTLQTEGSTPRPNSVFSIRFGYGSTKLTIPSELSAALIDEAKQAPLVVLRGRTDGQSESPIEGRIARERASTVRDHLVAAGVDPALIRATYQPAGDHAADNSSIDGRASNRRVEIEVYRVAPVLVGTATAVAKPSRPVQP